MKLGLVAAAALFLTHFAAYADTYNYSYTVSDNGVVYDSFTASSPTLITTATTLFTETCTETTYNGYPCSAAIVDPVNGFIELLINDDEGTTEPDRYPKSLFQLGHNTYGDATLNIVDVPSVTTATTPEPSSFALLGTGLLGVAGVVRRRLA